ncbi:MAG: hypothetical protein R3C14_15295 [Caldilineaceae bacterium]
MRHQFLEWQFCDTDAETEWPPQTPSAQLVAEEPGKTTAGAPQPSPKARYLYELICGIALLYGITVYLLWQQATEQTAAIERDMITLRNEFTAFKQRSIEDALTTTDEIINATSIETPYLQFEASPETVGTVKQIVLRVDTKYQQLHQDFGLSLPVDGKRFKIFVDSGIYIADPVMHLYYPSTNEEQLVVIHPKFAARRYGISEDDALTTELFARLAMNLIEKAVASRAIKPQWQGMTLALKTHVQLEHGFSPDWQWQDMFLLHRYNAQSISLAFVHDVIHAPEGANEEWSQPSPTAYATANTLVEFILVTYGDDKVSALLDAFTEHDSWETLTPALFHLSADEFAEQWHAYLRKHYPIPS